jgi:hypothetical protein
MAVQVGGITFSSSERHLGDEMFPKNVVSVHFRKLKREV